MSGIVKKNYAEGTFNQYSEIFRERVNKLVAGTGKAVTPLAVDKGFQPSSFIRLLNGSRDPSLTSLVRIAKGFEVSIDWLVGLTDENIESIDEFKQLINLYEMAEKTDRDAINAILQKYRNREAANE